MIAALVVYLLVGLVTGSALLYGARLRQRNRFLYDTVLAGLCGLLWPYALGFLAYVALAGLTDEGQ